MAEVRVLDVLLHGAHIGTPTQVPGDRTLFAFVEDYVADEHRSVRGLSFKDRLGELITTFRPSRTRLLPFFSNLLPEGYMRSYLAERAGVNEKREFFLQWVLCSDLPGAVTVTSANGEV